jgi:hypothetical protein
MKTKSTPSKLQLGKQTDGVGGQGVSGPPINLYWVTTDDNEEDWFIFARTRRAAASFHENYEGYDTYEASARTILSNVQVVKYVTGPPPCHAQIEDLQTLGFEIIDSPAFERAVRFRGELFVEGCMEALVREFADNQFEAAGKGRPNGTKQTART